MYQRWVCALCAACIFSVFCVAAMCSVLSPCAVYPVYLLCVPYAPGIWYVLCVFAVRCVLCVGPAVHHSVTQTPTYLLFLLFHTETPTTDTFRIYFRLVFVPFPVPQG